MKTNRIYSLTSLTLALLSQNLLAQVPRSFGPYQSDPGVLSVLAAVKSTYGVPAVGGAVFSASTMKIGAYGLKRSDALDKVELGDSFHLGSCTKSMTATLAGLLVERHKITWNTTVTQAFPNFAAQINPQLQMVTLRQLLTHRSGIVSLTEGGGAIFAGIYTGSPSAQRHEFAKSILTQAPAYQIGTFNYSNAGYGIAGAMLEQATGRSYEDLLQSEVFGQLGGKCHMWWPALDDLSQPWGHLEYQGQYVPDDPKVRFEYDQAQKYFNDFISGQGTPTPELISGLYNMICINRTTSPAGAASLNILDFANYAQAHLRGALGLRTIISAQTMQVLHTPANGSAIGKATYAMGWLKVRIDGVDTWFHDGSADPFYALMIYQPSRDLGAVSFANSGGPKGAASSYEIAGRLLKIKDLQKKIADQLQ